MDVMMVNQEEVFVIYSVEDDQEYFDVELWFLIEYIR